MLAEAQQVWSCYSVLNVLYSLVQKSGINEQLKAEKEGKSAEEVAEVAGDFGSKPLYRNLGYFSLICLLRVHTLLGDPTCEFRVTSYAREKLTRYSGAADDGECRAWWRGSHHPNHCLSRKSHRVPRNHTRERHSTDSPGHDVLPRRMRIHGARAMARCHQDLCVGLDLLCPNEALPHEKLPVRLGTSSVVSCCIDEVRVLTDPTG